MLSLLVHLLPHHGLLSLLAPLPALLRHVLSLLPVHLLALLHLGTLPLLQVNLFCRPHLKNVV